MRLSKRQLKRIIREEYSRLKRQGLITEMMGKGYMINDAMGGPEDQSFPAGTTVRQAADQMVRDMQADYPGCLEELQSMNLSVDELERMGFNMEDELGECVGEAIEFMDIEGSGNFESRSCVTALHGAIYGRRSMAESRRRRGLIKESYDNPNIDSEWDIDEEGMPLQSLENCAADQVAAYFNASIISDLDACGVTNPSDLDSCHSLGCSAATCEAVNMAMEGLDMDGSGHWAFQDYTKALYDAMF